ncbi:hypothetical protein DBV08_04960 [Rhodococcus sp. KBW08]|nr:hypothetical protein [Rhodococcus sp. IC4_135]RQO50785.1 hypothetical protein DBV08_04960 [Rhodococcus sp. KBW08]UJC76581.1 hypothetical protein D4768_02025 [Rhodococcus erythropolis]
MIELLQTNSVNAPSGEPAHTEWVDGRDTRAQQAVWKGISAQFEVRIRVVNRGIEPRWSSKET